MADFSIKNWAKLSGERKALPFALASRGALRLVGACAMAGLLIMNRSWPISFSAIFGSILLALIAGLMLRAHIKTKSSSDESRRTTERLVWFTSLLAVGGTQIANLSIDPNSFSRVGFLLMAPIVAQSMLTAALITPGIGIIGMSMSVLLLGITGALPMDLAAGTWLAGAVAVHVVNPLKQRSDLIRAMSIQVSAQAVICASMVLVLPQMVAPAWEAAVWGMIAAVIATAIFWLGVAVLEKIFHIVSDWTLLELCSPDQPMIRELVLRAPGTYAHSVGVGNLAEEAARAIGANPLLCRTMAYYHDIGKTARPNYFIENQIGQNIHDDLSPSLSAQIIAAHVSDGVDLAKKHKLPQILIDGIEQHHGTSLITFFYYRAVEERGATPGQDLEKRFRYPGPKPQTKEAAILHLADIAEATSRTLARDESLELIIAKLIESSRADGQLDESELTFKDLGAIAESFCRTLRAVRHERISYPEGASTANPIGAPMEINQGGAGIEANPQGHDSESSSKAQGS